MLKNNEDKQGIIKIYWKDVRNRVNKVAPILSSIIDQLNPDDTFPLYLAYYPYGATIADIDGFYLPRDKGADGFKLTDDKVPNDLIKDLGYAKDSLPMGLVLEKTIEYSVNLKDENTTMPWLIYSHGSFFPFSRVLSKKNQRTYAPNGVLTLTSGERSVIMLPNIGSTAQHSILQRDFNIQAAAPKLLYEHWPIFKEIVNSPMAECDWRSCILFFSEKWLEKIHSDDKAWKPLKLHLHELSWDHYEFQRNYIYYEMAFSMIQKKRNLKPNPYLVDTARHLFSIALGAAPGYVPACSEDELPLGLLQKAYVESYGLDKYLPTIMRATHFKFESDKFPIYYSLKHPSTYVFSPKSRKLFSALIEMRELVHIMKIFAQELQKPNEMCSDTIVSKIAKDVEFSCFHNEKDLHKVVKMSSEIPKLDDRFERPKYKTNNAVFARDAPFVRGCVMIKSKTPTTKKSQD